MELSVGELFQQGEYIIPIYQRNYAWGEPEIEQLLQDIWDVASSIPRQETYFIGSLVTDQRNEHLFETIDGQQRHTTLSILISVLKNEFFKCKSHPQLSTIEKLNLHFDSRPLSVNTLRSVFNGSDGHDEEQASIRSAYYIATRFIREKIADVDLFTDYLLTNVKLLRVVVPEKTDLNHYFEIMNNRGEQLEKHEVLKSRLMSTLDSDVERHAFAMTWDACADMQRYAQMGIKSDFRKLLFGAEWNDLPRDFNYICTKTTVESNDDSKLSMRDILANVTFHKNDGTENKNDVVTYGSVINFSNFLLHVLSVYLKADVPLDDKRLLDIFEQNKANIDAKDFAVILLKCRVLFDSYILKRKKDEDWSLEKLKPYKNKNNTLSPTYSGTVSNSMPKNAGLNKQILMILSMFHVSFPTLVYKHWLSSALHFLFENTNDKGEVDPQDYLDFLEGLNDKFFFGRMGNIDNDKEQKDYYDLGINNIDVSDIDFDSSHLHRGTGVQNFIFNRLDYLLWKKLKQGESFTGVNMKYVNAYVEGFDFTFRTSVEHYFPQNPLSSEKLGVPAALSNGVDSFGNLCLISRSDNSKLNNYLPIAKKEHYQKSPTTESLKQVFMMSYKEWGEGDQGIQNIVDHEKMMIKVLCQRFIEES